MDASSWWIQLGVLAVQSLLVWFATRHVNQRDQKSKEQTADIKALTKELADLKASLPDVYTTWEKFIWAMSMFDNQLGRQTELLTKINDSLMRERNGL